MFLKAGSRINDKYITKGALAATLITVFFSTLCITIITASDNDTRVIEILPSILGALVFLGSVYLINVIKSQVTRIINDFNLNRRISLKRVSVGSALAALDRELHRKQKNSVNAAANTYDRIKLWYSYSKLSLTCMLKNAGVSLIIWDFLKLFLWLITLTYWRRDAISDRWDYSLVPKVLYPLHFFSISASTAEICLFILEAKDSKDIFNSPIFWINSLILPPPVLISRWLFFPDLSCIQVYWTHGFIIWIKLFVWINNRIIATKDGSEKAKCIFRISLGSLYIMQGLHPTQIENQFKHSFAQYLSYFYLAIITFSTVGYGDMVPVTIEARMCAICYIFWMVIWVPLTINRTLEIVLAKNILVGHLNSWAGLTKFILVVGDIDPSQLSQFISKMYYTKDKCKIIVLTPNDIETYTAQVKQADNLSISLCIMRGDIEVDGNLTILDTIQARLASSIFILSSFKGKDLRMNDMKTILRTIGMKKYGCRSEIVMVQYCAPVTHSIFQKQYGISMSLSDLKLCLVTKSITCPGIITLIVNLSLNQYYNIGHTQNHSSCPKSLNLYQSYLSGAEKSVCFHKIPEHYVGVLFEVLCETFFDVNDAILIGIISIDDPLSYKINPVGSNYYIKKGDTGIFILDFDTSPDFSKLNLTNEALIKRNTILLKLIRDGKVLANHQSGSSLSSLTFDLDDSEPQYNDENEDELYKIESALIFPVDAKKFDEPYDPSVPIVVNTLSSARSNIFKNKDLPVVTIIGYSDFVTRLLFHFSTINEFNVIIAGNMISKSLDLQFLQRFKRFVAVIDLDLMKYTEIIGSELHLSSYFYITPNSFETKLDNNSDLCTIVIYRQIRNVIKTLRNANYNWLNNVFGIVELQNLGNVTFLDDSKWSHWNTYNENVDSSLIYINSHYYAMGQIISDEMFYNVIIGSFSSSENYMLYNIMMDMISIPGSKRKNKGVELIRLSDVKAIEPKTTFGHMFINVLKEMDSILIGIFRIGSTSMENYVICSPSKDFLLEEKDMGYIISKQ
ncbi:hypothetical protein MACJ_002934 [Theileria orientalis]|uniref:Ion transport protein n=1 Tax=Theileria orientalis TaxID=68886 RepID=A0A976M6T4_THEOR|nr:hypothetical protein MACJ_002934 [Theileria orientalis]